MANIKIEGQAGTNPQDQGFDARMSRRDAVRAFIAVGVTGAAAVGLGAWFYRKSEERKVDFINHFRPGVSPDEGGYGAVRCFNNPGLFPRPESGKFELVKRGDGTTVTYQSVDPQENCVTKDHPNGTKYAVFQVYDANPDTPGVAVSNDYALQAPENAKVTLPPRVIEFARWLLGLDNSSSK